MRRHPRRERHQIDQIWVSSELSLLASGSLCLLPNEPRVPRLPHRPRRHRHRRHRDHRSRPHRHPLREICYVYQSNSKNMDEISSTSSLFTLY